MLITDIDDDQFEDVALTEVRECDSGFEVKREDGWSFLVPGKSIKPAVGDVVRFYGQGIGYTVRGVAINGQIVFYRSESRQAEIYRLEAEQRDADRQRELDQTRKKRDAAWARLPAVFQERFERFNRNLPTWRRDHEEYERFCCEQAVVIARAIDPGPATPAERQRIVENSLKGLADAKLEDQVRMVNGLSHDHSGNTFGMALRLAWLYLLHPELVSREHSAFCPVLGCKGAGCVPVGAAEYVGT